jgi:hypothetical protein
MDMRRRYERDPKIRAIVDMMRYQIKEMEMTPTEMREAAVLACYLVEMEAGPRDFHLSEIGVRDRLIWAELGRADSND